MCFLQGSSVEMVDETDQNCREKSNSARKKLDAQKPTKIEDVPFRCTYSLDWAFPLKYWPHSVLFVSYSLFNSCVDRKIPFWRKNLLFITHKIAACSIHWGPSLRALCPSKEIEGKYVFLGSWPLRILFTPTIAVQMASQGICIHIFERIRKP